MSRRRKKEEPPEEEPLVPPLEGELEAQDRTRRIPCPTTLVGEPWESMWLEALEQLQEQGTWRVTDAPMLQALIELRRQASDARREGSAEPLVIGSTGQAVANPLLMVADRAEALAARLAEQLILTPRARSAHRRDAAAEGESTEAGDEFSDLEEPTAPPPARRRGKTGK